MTVSLQPAFAAATSRCMTRNESRQEWWADLMEHARWGWRVSRHGRRNSGVASPLSILTDRRNARGQGAPRNRTSRSLTGCTSPDSSSVSSRGLLELDRMKGDVR
jgi:hypothetical protein